MNCEDLLVEENLPVNCDAKREKLMEIIVSGKSKLYLGIDLTPEKVSGLSGDEVVFFHNRYEKVLGSQMVRSIGHSLISLYANVVDKLFTVDNRDDLVYDLKQDVVLNNTLADISRLLYYQFGGFLAPISASLITVQHLKYIPLENGSVTGVEPDTSSSEGGSNFSEDNEN